MRMSLAVVLTMLIPVAAQDQVLCTLGTNPSSYNAYSDQRPSSDAMQLATPVNAALAGACSPKCPRISLFRNPTASNAMLIASNQQMKIVYNPPFFTMVYDAYGDAGIQAILAHEAGHAIDTASPADWTKRDWTPELRADAWTGCALARVNLNARQLRLGLAALSKYPSPSHPDWNTRFQVIRVGYVHCGGDAAKLN
jgi:hypothetical protein